MNQSFTNYAITREQFDAVLFDLDGVLTDTSSLHAACWKKIISTICKWGDIS